MNGRVDNLGGRRPKWHTVGLYLTAAWLLVVAAVTAGDRTHPLFDYIFIVPLAAWIAAMLTARLAAHRRSR